MLENDLLNKWDRENFMHPSTHLAQHERGETVNRIMSQVPVLTFRIEMVTNFLMALLDCTVSTSDMVEQKSPMQLQSKLMTWHITILT